MGNAGGLEKGESKHFRGWSEGDQSNGRDYSGILWKTLLFGAVVLLFRFAEEIIPLSSKYGGVVAASRALFHEISWPVFGVPAPWILGGLLLYCLATELARCGSEEDQGNALWRTQQGISPR